MRFVKHAAYAGGTYLRSYNSFNLFPSLFAIDWMHPIDCGLFYASSLLPLDRFNIICHWMHLINYDLVVSYVCLTSC